MVIKENVIEILKSYSNITKVFDKKNTAICDRLIQECIKKLGVEDEKIADEMFPSVYNYVFGLENTEEDLEVIMEYLKEAKYKTNFKPIPEQLKEVFEKATKERTEDKL